MSARRDIITILPTGRNINKASFGNPNPNTKTVMKNKPQTVCRNYFRPFAAMAVAMAVALPSRAGAQTSESTLVNDASGASCLIQTTNWTPATTVAPTNALATTYNYTVTNTVRTPADLNAYYVQANEFLINTGGILGFKGSNVITFANLVLNGGTVQNSGTSGNPDEARLAGSINLQNSTTLAPSSSSTVGRIMNVLGTITNAPGSSPTLTVNAGGAGTLLLSAQNTFSGSVVVANTTPSTALQLGINNALPEGATLMLNGGSKGSPIFDMNGYSQTIGTLNSSSGAFTGFVTNTAPGTVSTLTLGYGDVNSTLSGAISDNPATAGTIALTKIGAGMLTLASTNNSYSGDTTISNGRLFMGASLVMPNGVGKGNVIIESPAIFDIAGRGETINGLEGDGTVDTSGGLFETSYILTMVPTNGVTAVFSGVIQNSYGAGYVGISMYGTNATESLTGVNTFDGPVNVRAGHLWINNSAGLGDINATKYISVQDNTTGLDAELHLNGTNGDITLPASFTFNVSDSMDEGAIVNEAGNNIIAGPLAVTTGGGSAIVTVNAGTLTLAGPVSITNTTARGLILSGAGNGTVSGVIADWNGGFAPNPAVTNLSLTKQGTGTWTLANADIYSGPTIINGGDLSLTGSASIANSTNIIIAGDAIFDVSGLSSHFALGANQTLGNSSSTAVISGNLTTGSGKLSLSYVAGTPSMTISNGTLALSSSTALNVNNTGAALTAGNYVLISNDSAGSPGTVTGTAPSVTVSGGGLAAGATASLQINNGLQLVVTSSAPSKPVLKTISVSGTTLSLTASGGSDGGNFVLLESTNLTLPLSQWTPVLTNSFDSSGNLNLSTNILNAATPAEFYTLQAP